MVGQEQASQARDHGKGNCGEDQTPDAGSPEACGGGWQDHDADGHQRSERVEATHEVQHDKREEGEMRHGAQAAHRAQELRVRAFENQRPQQQRKGQHREAGDRAQEDQRVVVEREHGAEEHVHEVDIAAPGGDDQHARRQRDQVESGEARVLSKRGDARDEARQKRHGHPGDQPADGHGAQREAGDQIADGRPRQDRVGHRVAGEAHPAQHQEDPHGSRTDGYGDAAHERAPHEAEIGEGLDEDLPHHAAPRPQVCGGPPQASHI